MVFGLAPALTPWPPLPTPAGEGEFELERYCRAGPYSGQGFAAGAGVHVHWPAHL